MLLPQEQTSNVQEIRTNYLFHDTLCIAQNITRPVGNAWSDITAFCMTFAP